MLIKKLKMEGFKNHKNKVEYDLGRLTFISGDNFKGKTTIGEAITWCIAGIDLTGNEMATNRLLNNKSKNMEVEIDFIFNGEDFNLIRSKRGSKTEIYLNGEVVKNTDLIKFYKDKHTFLSIFNPDYFAGLTPKIAKETLDSVLKKIDNQEILEEMSEFERNLLLENNFKNSNLFLTKKREELKELEKDVLFSEGFIAAKKEEVVIPDEKTFNDKELLELNAKSLQITEKIQSLKNVDKVELIEVSTLEQERQSLLNQYNRYTDEYKALEDTVECPNCNHEIDLNKSTRERLIKEINQIKSSGKEVAAKIDQANKDNEKILEAYNKNLKENETEFNKLEKELSNIEKYISVQEQIKREVENNNLNRSSLLKLKEENESKILKAQAEIDSSEDKMNNINLQIDAAKAFNSIKLKLQSKNIDKHLKNVSIRLEKITKDGELKDDFKILYKDREFNILSTSERIKAGLEISNLIMAQVNMIAPIFIDNAESITEYTSPDTQIIEAKVVEGQELIVEAREV